MDFWEDPDLWRWLWLIAAAVFFMGEMAIPTSFFLVSFAVGALVACVLAFFGATLGIQWLAFVFVSLAALLVLRPYSRRLDRETEDVATFGANRWVGKTGTVISEIPPGPASTGLVRIEREEWRAESAGEAGIATGSLVQVIRVDGTRLIVTPTGGTGPTDIPAP